MMYFSQPCLRVLLPIVLVSAPLAAQKVTTNFDATTDFGRLETFAWHRDSLERELTEQAIPVDRAIRSTAEDMLARRGMRKVDAADADVLVSYVGTLYDRIGLPDRDKIRVSDSVSLGADPSLVGVTRSYKEGTLILQIFAADGERLLWTGTASETGTDTAWYKEGPKKAEKLTRKVLKQYPPK